MDARIVLLVTLLSAPARGAEEWSRLAEDGGALVEQKQEADGRRLVRTTLVLPHSAAAVREVLLDLEGFPRWFPNLHGWQVLERREGAAFVYGRHDLPWPFEPRDYVVRYAWSLAPDGGLALEARSTSGKGPPEAKGVVRLPRVRSTWSVAPTPEGRARVVYVYDTDLAGVPDFLQAGAWKTEGPALLRALSKEVARRNAVPAAPSPP